MSLLPNTGAPLTEPERTLLPLLPAELKYLVGSFRAQRYSDVTTRGEDLLKEFAVPSPVMNLIGLAYVEQNETAAAIRVFSQSAASDPGNSATFKALANTFHRSGRLDDALNAYTRACELEPDNAETHYNIGHIFFLQDEYQLAETHLEHALRLDPAFPGARDQLKKLLLKTGPGHLLAGEYEAALTRFSRAAELDPEDPVPATGLGETFLRMNDWQTAEKHFLRVLELDENNTTVRRTLGNRHYSKKDYKAAIGYFRSCFEIDPHDDFARSQYLICKARLCDWTCFDEYERVKHTIGSFDGEIVHHGLLSLSDDPELVLQRGEWTEEFQVGPLIEKSEETEASGALMTPHISSDHRIRVGFFCGDFNNHATTYLIWRVFEHHDHERFDFHAFSLSGPTGDTGEAHIKKHIPNFHDVSGLESAGIAQMAREKKVGIAVDLNARTARSRFDLFARRPAPVQISYLAYPATTGARYMDYIIGDPVVIPDGSEHCYSEKPLRLPETYQPCDEKRTVWEAPGSRSECGLPEEGFVFCSFNLQSKITPRDFDIWMRLLKEVRGSVLWLLSGPDEAVSNLRSEAVKRGIDANRLVFAPRVVSEAHLARHKYADLFLDSVFCNAHTTANDALYCGVPLITRPGRQFASRVAASLLTAAGLPELIAADDAGYEALALELATSPEKLNAIRLKLDQARLNSALFNSERYTRHLEKAFELAFERFAAGLPPDLIDVPALPSR